MIDTYRIFDRVLASEVPLPELAPADGQAVEFEFSLHKKPRPPAGNWLHVHEWRLADGEISLSCARQGERYRLRFPQLADFEISGCATKIRCIATSDTGDNTIRHLLLDQVIPRVVSHNNRLVTHAAAVQFDDGRAAALLGPTGAGKSTLAAALHVCGARLLSDDCLLLESAGSRVTGIASYRGLRLWPDTAAAMFPGTAGLSPMAHYSSKQRVDLPSTGTEPVELSALILLSPPPGNMPAGSVNLSRASGSEALTILIANQFVLDITDHERTRRSFEEYAKLVKTGIPVFLLAYPRQQDLLGEVCEAVESACRAPAGEESLPSPKKRLNS